MMFSALSEEGFDLYDLSDTWQVSREFFGCSLVIGKHNTFDYDAMSVDSSVWVSLEVQMLCGGKIEAQYWYGKKFEAWEDALEHAKGIIAQGENWQPLIEFRNDPRSDLSKGRY